MTQINTQRCDQAPIHNLPDEILEEIFLINTSKSVVRNHPHDPHSTTLATSQVCQRWRAVALDYPIIWSRIINYEQHSPSWIETLLARSGSALIDIGGDSTFESVTLEPPRSRPVLQSIFQRITSLKTVSLHVRSVPWDSICRSFLGYPAPNLEFLSLTQTSSFSNNCHYPNPIFADQAPCLRRLHLEKCLIDFSSSYSVLSNLTELSVQDVLPKLSISTHSVPSVAEWLRILKNIPSLRFLTLISAISPFTKENDPPLPVVDLPQLALLSIWTRFYSGVLLIDHLNIPPSCGIDFGLYPSPSGSSVRLDNPKLMPILSFLSKQLTHWSQNCSYRYLQAKILEIGRAHV